MKFTAAFTMFDPAHLIPLAQVAEDAGFDSVCVPDSVFYPERSGPYPFSKDGKRLWARESRAGPVVAVPAMAAVTTSMRFQTSVLKFPLRNPLLAAKQAAPSPR